MPISIGDICSKRISKDAISANGYDSSIMADRDTMRVLGKLLGFFPENVLYFVAIGSKA
jgi:hypothetical protein